MSDWIEINRLVPEEGDRILAYYGGDNIEVAEWDGSAWWVLLEFTIEPSHWMALPKAPNTTDTEE